LSGITRKRNREGRPWAAATLEDLNGKLELLVFANQYEALSDQLEEDLPVLVRGSVRQEEGASPKVAVNEIVPLDLVRVPLPAQISITVRLDNGHGSGNGETAAKLRELFESKPGETDVRLRLLRSKDFLMFYDLATRVKADREFRQAVEELCGSGSLEIMPS
jgi:DNA polymerase-3 subunit alpha